MRRLLALFLLSMPGAAFACDCKGPTGVCQRVAASEVIFIGTVESITPHFLDYWNASQHQSLTLLNAEMARAQADRTASSLTAAKSAYAEIFPDLPGDAKKLLDGASSHNDLVKAFYAILGNGRRVRFSVKSAYRGDEDEGDTVDVWTPFGDCGYDFQTGETYLVFANGDEETGVVSTASCSGTKRLSDAGADLAYLYFYAHNDDDAARLDGFATTNELHQVDAAQVQGPVAGLVVELKAAHGSRFAETGADGKFVFDGLPAGEYALSAYSPGYPRTVHLLAGPQHVRVEPKACAAATLLIFKPPER